MDVEELNEASRRLNSFSIHLLRAMRRVDAQSGLTPARMSALSVLHFGGPRSLGRLARDEEVTSATMSRLVDALCSLGLVERRPHPEHRGMVVVAVLLSMALGSLRVVGATLITLLAGLVMTVGWAAVSVMPRSARSNPARGSFSTFRWMRISRFRSSTGVSDRRSRTVTSCPLLSVAVLAARQARWRAVGSSDWVVGDAGAPNEVGTEDGTGARLELLKGVTANEPEAAPGTKFIYSNGGFAMAGAMLERKAGKGWEELLTERVFRPLGITSAGFGAPGTRDKFDQPCGHRAGKPVLPGPGSDNPVAIGPAGIVNMTILDWARFAMAHADGEWTPKEIGEVAAGSLLKPEAWKLLHTPYVTGRAGEKDEYAGGWIVATRPWAKGKGEKDTGRVLNHNGSNTMWYCVAWVAPERRFAVVVASNQGDGEVAKATDEAAWALIQDTLKP